MVEDKRLDAIEAGHETSDADIKPVLIFMIGLAALTGICLMLMALLFGYFAGPRVESDARTSPRLRQEQIPPEPRLQTNPARELQQIEATEQQKLNSPAWVDRDSGTVRVPIGRAMDLAIEKNLFPSRESQTSPEEERK